VFGSGDLLVDNSKYSIKGEADGSGRIKPSLGMGMTKLIGKTMAVTISTNYVLTQNQVRHSFSVFYNFMSYKPR
jgi:hypothetical protein